MVDSLTKDDLTKDDGEQPGKQEEKQEEKDEYGPKSRMKGLQKEFHLSDLEVDELTRFLSSTKSSDMFGIIEEMIKCESLNIRQKVAFAHALGIFRTEGSMSFRIRSSQD
jgi:hypothetical protein